MATYPLKNISVGGDIYQIKAGPEYVTVKLAYDLEDTSTTFSGTLAEIMANNVGSWSILSIDKNGISYDPTTTMLSTLTGRKQYSADWTIRDANGAYNGEFAGLQINYQYFTLAIPGKTNSSDFTGIVKLQVNELNNTVTQKGILLPGGGGGGSSSIKEIVINQIGTGDANASALWNIGSNHANVLNGPNDYKTKWADSSVTYVLKLQQDGTLIYLNQRLKNGSSIYTGYATIYNYDFNDPQSRNVQFICNGSPTLQYFTVKKCASQ